MQDTVSGVFVHGRVETEAGAGVPGVQLRIGYTRMNGCGTNFINLPGIPTDSAGTYGALVAEFGGPQTVCVKVVATPPASLPLAPDSVLVPNVQFTERLGGDSVRVDLVLPPK